jgi:hypothetical protein
VHKKTEPSARTSEAQIKHLDRLLDEALQETFPASDPVSISSDDRAPQKGSETAPTTDARSAR